jgi:hypothetical protein
VLVVDVASGRRRKVEGGRGRLVLYTAFSADGRFLLYGLQRGGVRMVPATGGPSRLVAGNSIGASWQPR